LIFPFLSSQSLSGYDLADTSGCEDASKANFSWPRTCKSRSEVYG
jgi:hypothetical protein